jgi:hypothetical protein
VEVDEDVVKLAGLQMEPQSGGLAWQIVFLGAA